jgi:ABC-type branched-subunit amino acid transport system permease subunit
VLIGAVLLLALLPVLNRLPLDSALHVSDFVVSVTGKWITYAVLALAIDLAWGYAGILSLGHGAFFALGGYAIGMHLMRLIGRAASTATPRCRTSWCSSATASCPGTGGASTTSPSRC